MRRIFCTRNRMAGVVLLAGLGWPDPGWARNIPPYMSWSEDPRTTVNLSWERDAPGRGTVHYGLTTNLGTTVHNGDCVLRHVFTLRDLAPGTRYHYQAASDDGFSSPISSFKTAPVGTTGSYRVAVFADTQQPVLNGSAPWIFDPATNHSKVIALVTNRAPDFYIVVGDLVWDNDWWLWEDWFEREKELLARAPIMPVMGNHEWFTYPHDGSHFFGLFTVPPAPGNGRYYDYTYGHSHFIALNSEDDPAGQRDFLARSLQAAANNTNIFWTFVYWHRTVYTWTDKHSRYQPAYSNFVPLISMYGADIVFSGHNHLYERSGPHRGAYYITTGGGGGNPTSPKDVPVGVVSSTAYHFVELDFNGSILELEALRWDGALMDSLTLTNRGRIVRVAPAFPQTGQPVRITYDADLGPLAGATQIHIHLGIDAFSSAVLDAPMTNEPGTGRWFIDTVVPPAATQRIAFAFRNQDEMWHSNHTFGNPALPLNWQALLAAPTSSPPAAPALPVVAPGSPVITGGGSPNNVGDNFDFNLSGGALVPLEPKTGFGTFGRLYFNYDSTNLYLGGVDTFLSTSSTNNALALFIGVDTLGDNAFNLWHKSGPPQLLDYLHNLAFTEPMDIAILYGDEYGDGGSFSNFSFGADGYNFGQGIFYIGTNSGTFPAVPGAQLSQFDGTNQVPTTTVNDDGNRRTDRWECAIPWSALNAPNGARSIDCLTIAGVIVSRSTNGTDRYLSGVVIGSRAYGAKDGNGNYAFNTLTLTPAPVLMPWADYTFNGLPNGWSHQHFGDALAPAPDDDPDGDGYDNRHEYVANTQPTNAQSVLAADLVTTPGGLEFRWSAAGDRAYDVYFTTNLAQPAAWLYLTNIQPPAGQQVLPIAPPPAEAGAFFLRARIPE
ncbi:MAG TPA: metallophosphoesterase family protein [Kiritimatiellia bacterium]|nr:metallophosphoesterase family protein [Kiritimatiellia bacterium]